MAEVQDDRKTVVVERERSSSGPIVAVVAVVVLIAIALFGLPYLTGGGSSTNVNVTPPVSQ